MLNSIFYSSQRDKFVTLCKMLDHCGEAGQSHCRHANCSIENVVKKPVVQIVPHSIQGGFETLIID